MTRGMATLSNIRISPVKQENPWTTVINARISARRQKTYDFYDVLESVAWIWRILGVFPATIHSPIGTKRYGFNKFYALYSVLIFALCAGNFICGMMQFGHYFRHHVPMSTITILIRTIASLLCLMLTNVWRTLFFKEFSESLNKIAEHELILEKIGCRCNSELNVKLIRIYVWTTFFIVFFFMLFEFRGTISKTHAIRLQWMVWMYPLFTQIMDLTILVSLVGWLGFEFRAVNDRLRAVVARANANSPKVIIMSDVCAENLRALSKAHYNICAIGKRINRIFDWTVIINVMEAFIILSTTLYYIFFEVERNGETNTVQIVTYIHWELMHSAPIIVVVISCNWTSRQGLQAGKLIHEIRVEKIDSSMYEAVKCFSLQLHHQKLEFTARGFFPLNSTLLQTMVGKITTYLVILIQFQPNLDDLFGNQQ